MEYEPLDATRGEMRIVTLLPSYARPGHPDEIYCALENVSLTDYAPSYEMFLGLIGHTRNIEDVSQQELTILWRRFRWVLTVEDEDRLIDTPLADQLNHPSLLRFT